MSIKYSKKLKPYIILGGILISLCFVIVIVIGHSSASAQGLVSPDPTGTGLATSSLIDTALNIINAALAFAGVIALIVLIYGGYIWMTSGGIPQRIALAKKVLLSAVIGFIIIILSWAIINFIIEGATGGEGGPGGACTEGAESGCYDCNGGSWLYDNTNVGCLFGDLFTVKWVDPIDGASDVPLCRIVQAGFSKNVDTGTVNTANTKIQMSCTDNSECLNVMGVPNLGTCTAFGDTMCSDNIASLAGAQFNFFDALGDEDSDPDAFEFIPPAEWEKDRTYRIELTTGVTSASGTPLSAAFVSTFSTGSTTDNTAPQVANIVPTPGGIDICRMKPISVVFNEPMRASTLKDMATLAVTEIELPANKDYAALEFSKSDGTISPADLTFSSSIPSPWSVNYSPKKPYDKNTEYFPILRAGEDIDGDKTLDAGEDLNGNNQLDGIQDACRNFLNHNQIDPNYGFSPKGDYGDYPGDGDDADVINYSFTTENSDDFQCDPEITLVETSPFYYDPPDPLNPTSDGSITIRGKNFGLSGDVLLKDSIVVNFGNNLCLEESSDPSYTNTGHACVMPANWTDDRITLIAPARTQTGMTLGGAIDGPIQVDLGGFAECSGMPLVCQAGRNKDKTCGSDNDCPVGKSNLMAVDIASPHISKMSPTDGPKGQWITLKGTDFGITQGTVRFINTANRTQWIAGNFPCTASWNDTSIIVELPIDAAFGPGDIEIQVERSGGRHSNFGTFTVNTDPLGPGICSISESCGEIGTTFNIEGKRFGTGGGNVVFRNDNAAAETLVAINPPDWGDDAIQDVAVPIGLPDAPYSIMARVVGFPDSNPRSFNKPCPGLPCDADTTLLGCQEDVDVCPALGPTYSCNTATCRCDNNPLPKVVEQNSCILGTQSPSPYRNQTDACLNADISVRFDRDMDNATLIKENIVIESCGTDQNCAAPASLTAVWVTRYFGSRVRKFNSATGAVVNDFVTATFPWNVAYNPAQNEMWVPHSGPGSPLRKYDAITGAQVGGDISNNGNPSGVVYDDKQNVVWVTYSGANNLRKFNATTGIQIGGNIVTGLNPSSVAYDSAQNAVWVVNYSSNTLQKFNAASGAQVGVNIATGINPEEVVYDPTQNALWVTNRTSNTLQKFNAADGTQIGGDINTGQTPRGITYDPAQNAIWVVNAGGLGTLQKFNAATGVQIGADIATGGNPSDVVYDSTQNAVWVAASGTNTVRKYSAVDGTQIGGNIATPDSPFRIAYSSPWTVSSPFIWGANGKEGITINVAPSILVSDTYYRVTLKQGIKANDYQLDGNGNSSPDVSPNDNYSWIFKTSNDSCAVKSISTSPANMSVAVSSSKPISAIPQAENCNTLNVASYNWSWIEASTGSIATVTNSVVPNQNQTVTGVKAGATTVSASIPAEPLVPAGTSNITVTNKLSCSDAGLAAVWKFDEAAGDAAVDSTANNNQGTLQNSPTRLSTGCKFGKCLQFDGNDDYINIPDSNSISMTSAITMEAWVKTSEQVNQQYVFAKNTVANVFEYTLLLDAGGIIRPEFRSSLDVYKTAYGTTNIADGAWHHIAATFDGSNIKIYNNGNLEKTESWISDIRSTTASDLFVGQLGTNSNQFFKGQIDEVRIWNKALDISEIKSIYNQRCEALDKISCSDPNLKAVWKLDENSGIVANDSTSNNNDGQLNMGASWTSIGCKFGGCLELDGNNEYVEVPDNPIFNFGDGINDRPFTFEAWVKRGEINPVVNPADVIFSKYYTKVPVTDRSQYWFRIDGDGSLNIYLISAGDNRIGIETVGTPLNNTNWHHVAATYEGNENANDLKIYVDGVAVPVNPFTVVGAAPGVYVAMSPTAASFQIGRYTESTGNGQNFLGLIDEPRVWDKALTQEEIISAMGQECKAGGTGAALQCTNDVIGVWNFDDGAGSMAADGSRNRNNGILMNGLGGSWNTNSCQFGSCLNFDGTDDYIEIADNSSLDVSNEVTVMLWANIENVDITETDNILLDKQTSDDVGPFGILLHSGNTPAYALEGRFVLSDATKIRLRSDFVPPTNSWHHYAITFKSGEQKLYFDGKAVGNNGASDNKVGKLIQNNLPIIIGSGAERETDYNTDAVIDEVRIYNRALSATEIANTYQKSMTQCVEATLYCSNPELTAVWKMDEGIGVVAGDSTANNLDGTLGISLQNPAWIEAGCYIGKCLDFNAGEGDYVAVPDNPKLNFGANSFTIEGWVKYTATARERIISKYSANNGYDLVTDNGQIQFNVCEGGVCDSVTSGATAANTGGWVHIAAVRDRPASELRLYVGGWPQGTAADNGKSASYAGSLYLGREQDTPYYYFSGIMDEFRIWNKALSDNEVQSASNQQCLSPQKGSACDLDLAAPMCQPNVGLCESGDPDLRCSIKSCTCQEAFTVNPPQPDPENDNPNFTRDSSTVNTDGNFFNDIACRNTAITVNFNQPIDASTVKAAKTTVKIIDPPLLSENFDTLALPSPNWTTVDLPNRESPHWPCAPAPNPPCWTSPAWTINLGMLYEQLDNGNGFLVTSNPIIKADGTSPGTNYRISFDAGSADQPFIENDDAIGFVFGYIDEKNYYQLLWDDPIDNYASLLPTRLVLQKKVNGTFADLAVKDNFIGNPGIAKNFAIEVRGTNITVSSSGQTLISYNDSLSAAILLNKVGFYTHDNDGGVFYDNLTINEIAPTITPGTVELYALQQASGNLLADGDMERTDTDVWKTYGTPVVVEKRTTPKHGGARSLYVRTDDHPAVQEGVYASAGTVNAGDQVRMRGWYYASNGSVVAAFAVGALPADLSTLPTTGVLNGVSAWKEFALDWEATSSGPLSAVFYSTPQANTNDFNIDDVSVNIEHNLAVDIATRVSGSQLTISPRQFLDPSRNYNLILKGTNDAYTYGEVIKSINGTPLEQPGDYTWQFDTGTEICKIGKAEIQFMKNSNAGPISYKGSDSFTCAGDLCADDMNPPPGLAGNQHGIEAKTYSTNGGPLGGIMTYNWTKSIDAPFDIVNASTEITAGSNNGAGTLYLDVDGGVDVGTAKASANITIALCENPWPAVPPFQDIPAATSTNFSLWYCRDAGNMQDLTDDLPNLTVQEVTMSPGSPKPMKEYFYYDDGNTNDAIGIRVYANPSRLPLSEWLDQNANVSGGQSGMFNGWQSVRAGRSLYVSAMNDVASGIYNNIYLISYSDKSSSTLIGIYNQMISNWKFMVNGISDADIAKLQRDIRRIDDLGKIATALDSYKTKNGSYPKLDAGTYLPGMSTSVWPSWQASFGNALQTSVPKDPINQLSNLMAWWKFDEGTGIATKDSSINAFDGRMEGNDIKWTPASDCKVGGCLDFGTVNHGSVIRVPREAMNGLDDFTTEFWVKSKNMPKGGCIISGANTTRTNELSHFLNDGEIVPGIKNDSVDPDFDVIAGDNQWHHTAVSREKGVVHVYIDGVLKNTDSTLPIGSIVIDADGLVIGQDQDCVRGCFDEPVLSGNFVDSFKGLLDELRIWNRALSGSEIALLAGGGFSEATGWNQDTMSFRCDAGTDFDSHIYHYQYNNTNSYNLYGALEYVGPNWPPSNTWRQTAIAAPFNACTNPSSCACYNYSPPVHGDGIVEGTETCDDGNVVSGDGCSAIGAIETASACNNDNTINPPGEFCDGTALNGQSCLTQGYAGGSFACNACGFDVSGCL